MTDLREQIARGLHMAHQRRNGWSVAFDAEPEEEREDYYDDADAVLEILARNAPKGASNSVECRPQNFANSEIPGLSEKTTDD